MMGTALFLERTYYLGEKKHPLHTHNSYYASCTVENLGKYRKTEKIIHISPLRKSTTIFLLTNFYD
jgi:hypothetical protein